MNSEYELTPHQRDLVLKLVEIEKNLPSEQQGLSFRVEIAWRSVRIIHHGQGLRTTRLNLRALAKFEYAVLASHVSTSELSPGELDDTVRATPVPITLLPLVVIRPLGDAARWFVKLMFSWRPNVRAGTLTAKAFHLYDQSQTLIKQPGTPIQEVAEQGRVGPEPMSPHDEHILFKLIEFDKDLPKDEQSHRFDVSVFTTNEGDAPQARSRGANSEKTITHISDTDTFYALGEAGYVEGGIRSGYVSVGGSKWAEDHISTVKLTEKAFQYYGAKHGFAGALADERREIVDSVISTEYPAVVSRLKKAYDDVWVTQPNEDWTGVAHECQSALRAFADKIYEPGMAEKTGDEQPRHDQ